MVVGGLTGLSERCIADGGGGGGFGTVFWGCGGGGGGVGRGLEGIVSVAEKRVRGCVRRDRGAGGAGGGAAAKEGAGAAAGVPEKKSLVRLGRLRREAVVVRGLDALASLHVPVPPPDPAEAESCPGV